MQITAPERAVQNTAQRSRAEHSAPVGQCIAQPQRGSADHTQRGSIEHSLNKAVQITAPEGQCRTQPRGAVLNTMPQRDSA